MAEDVIIDEEIAGIIPQMTPEEYQQLENNIVAEGCRDALVVWAEEQILLDGHHRLQICQDHDVPFKTEEVCLADRTSALGWVALNQLGRRNLTNWQKAQLGLKLKPLVEARAQERMLSGGEADPGQVSEQGRTLDIIAEKTGLSRDTLHKAQVITENAEPQMLEQLADGSMSINRAYEEVRDEHHDRISTVPGVEIEEPPPPPRKRFSVRRLDGNYQAIIRTLMDLRDDYEACDFTPSPSDRETIEAIFENLVERIGQLREQLKLNGEG